MSIEKCSLVVGAVEGATLVAVQLPQLVQLLVIEQALVAVLAQALEARLD